MPKQAKSDTRPGSAHSSSQKGKPRVAKVIPSTVDLLKRNERDKANGKGKERAVLGDVSGLVMGESGVEQPRDVGRLI